MIEEAYLHKVREVLSELRVRADSGLTESAVRRHRVQYGSNILPRSDKRGWWWLWLDRFKDVLVMVLVVAAVIAVLFGHYADAFIILIAIFLDAGLSFTQAWRAEKTLDKIKETIQPKATVRRNGTTKVVPASALVVGDIVELSAGQKVPADARLLEVHGLSVIEASLTGEANDVEKSTEAIGKRTIVGNRNNMVFMGTLINSGSARAVVTTVGAKSELGKIAQILKGNIAPPSPLRRKLQRVGWQIGVSVIGAVGLLVVFELLLGQDPIDTAMTAVTLMVSAVPEDLTMILTISLMVGVMRILRNNGVVKNLTSSETLGAATVICVDKTGTLTEGKMKVMEFDFLQGDRFTVDDEIDNDWQRTVIASLMLANKAQRVSGVEKEFVGSATEIAALSFAEEFGTSQADYKQKWRLRSSIPFSRQWKYRAGLHDHPTAASRYLFAVGAPESLLNSSSKSLNEAGELVDLTSERRFEIRQRMEAMAGGGYRLLGVTMKRDVVEQEVTHEDVNDMIFLGVAVISDPVRPQVASVIRQTKRAGVLVKIVTGDHAETAKEIARQVGIGVRDGMVLQSDDIQRMTDTELDGLIERVAIFSRITPLDKQRIVKSLQRQGHIVAMTGDGVNDAVALKTADIGVAMGSGREIAREAADLILLDDKFETIVAAIKEGRVLRDNIRKVLTFLLATNVAEVAIFFVSLIFGWPLPLLPAQILWVNLVTDGTSDMALALEPAEDDVMERRPEDPKESILNRVMLWHIAVTGLIVTIATVLLYWYLLKIKLADLVYARTMIFTFISVVSLLSVWSYRSLKELIIKKGLTGNPWIVLSLIGSAGLHLLAVYVPVMQKFFGTMALGLKDWGVILVLAIVTVIIVDLRKLWLREKLG